jgi:hypothetical protein
MLNFRRRIIKKKIMMIAVAALVAGLLVVPVIAKGPSGPAGNSNIAHLYLYEKENFCDVGDDCWTIVEEGAWGKMKCNKSGSTFDFVFNGHDLEAGEEYTLIYYPDPWPGEGLICLGSGTANDDGDVHIMGSVDTLGDNLPAPGDTNTGAKIWLVLSADVDCEGRAMGGGLSWTPAEYLFEEDLIAFTFK